MKVPITLWVHLDVEIGDQEDGGQFHIEENHCIENHVLQLVAEMDAANEALRAGAVSCSVCILCARGGAVLGTHDLGAMVAKGRPA